MSIGVDEVAQAPVFLGIDLTASQPLIQDLPGVGPSSRVRVLGGPEVTKA